MLVADHGSHTFHSDNKQVSAKEKGSVLMTEPAPPGRMLENNNSFHIEEEVLIKNVLVLGACVM